MATNTSLVLGSVDQSGNKSQKTVVDVNGNTDGVILREFGEQLNGLTTNTFGEVVRIDKTGLDTESGDGTKITPTLTITPATISRFGHQSIAPYCPEVDIAYTGDGELSYTPESQYKYYFAGRFVKSGDSTKFRCYGLQVPTTVTISAAATDACESVSAVVTYQ